VDVQGLASAGWLRSVGAVRVAFRADASLHIGTGHIMRSLTLAEALSARGYECYFISREHPGHQLELIRQRGFAAIALPVGAIDFQVDLAGGSNLPAHAAWLGCDWQSDAQQTGQVLAAIKPDWLVVDHYGLDERWESALQPYYQRLFVIDDLADRTHGGDLLLDQNFGRDAADYAGLVPERCTVLTGPQYALLRPEFAALRASSLQRRSQPALKRLLITMGGVDKSNATGQVLDALKVSALPVDCRVSIIMGAKAPFLRQVQEQAIEMPWSSEVLVSINDMAQRMADSDLAIGAAGGTAWERCCLGLPTLMAVIANNQWSGAKALQAANGVCLIGEVGDIAVQLSPALAELTQGDGLARMSRIASRICDGQGIERVIHQLWRIHD